MNKFNYHNCIGTSTNFHDLLYEITVEGLFLFWAIFIIINKDNLRHFDFELGFSTIFSILIIYFRIILYFTLDYFKTIQLFNIKYQNIGIIESLTGDIIFAYARHSEWKIQRQTHKSWKSLFISFTRLVIVTLLNISRRTLSVKGVFLWTQPPVTAVSSDM